MRARYLTTTLPYVNAEPHIGFAFEIVQADVLARMWRAAGNDIFFSTGTDEHGQKIDEAAKAVGQKPRVYVDQYAAEFQKLKKLLDLSNNVFIRTTDPAHIKAAQEMWRRCEAKGDIYKKAYSGLYCVGCESFKTEKEIVDGKCPLHSSLTLERVSEENYFFRFSKYEKQLLAYLGRPGVIVPEWRRAEAVAFVKGGLEDFSISREKKRLSWGVPVPGDDSQTMYVWFDALTNYISTLGWPSDDKGNFEKFWIDGTTLQVAGKDQVRFQSLMWQGILLSADIKNTDQIFYHGFITSGGQKMSKSLGNVINPLELVEKYGTDAVRYILLRHVSPTEDSDLTPEAIHEYYTAHLTNGLGNLVARVMKLSETYLKETPQIPNLKEVVPETQSHINAFEFNLAMDRLWHWMQTLDELIQEQKTFEVVKTNKVAGEKQLTYLLTQLAKIAVLLEPFMPDTSRKIIDAIRNNKKPENLFPRLPAGTGLAK